MQSLKRKNARRGQGLVEYILMVFLMAIVCIAVVKDLSSTTQKGFTKATDKMDAEFGR